MMNDLTQACFSADAGTNVSIVRQNLQIEYTNRLIQIALNKGKVKYDHLSVSTSFNNLNKIKKHISKTSGVDESTKAHRKYIHHRIEKALEI